MVSPVAQRRPRPNRGVESPLELRVIRVLLYCPLLRWDIREVSRVVRRPWPSSSVRRFRAAEPPIDALRSLWLRPGALGGAAALRSHRARRRRGCSSAAEGKRLGPSIGARWPWPKSADLSAEACDRHVGRYVPELAAAMIQLVQVRSGQRALDELPAQTALADLLGTQSVVAVDPFDPSSRSAGHRPRRRRARRRVARSRRSPTPSSTPCWPARPTAPERWPASVRRDAPGGAPRPATCRRDFARR